LANGPIPEGLWILHHCDNPPCVNPNHLYAGTSAENIRDAVVRGRMRGQRKSHCKLGHAKEGDNLVVISIRGKFSYRCRKCENERSRLNQAKRRLDHGLMGFRLTEDEKARIIELGRDGLSHRKIASMVGRSSSSVQRVMQGAGQ
jgi:transposase-like protein